MGGSLEQQLERKLAFVQELKCLPVAVQTAAANEQHYEVGPAGPAAHLQQ
jgi:cation-transporting ATPase 13A3/4/5